MDLEETDRKEMHYIKSS